VPKRTWRLVNWLLFSRPGRTCWWIAGAALVYNLTLAFQRAGWLS